MRVKKEIKRIKKEITRHDLANPSKVDKVKNPPTNAK